MIKEHLIPILFLVFTFTLNGQTKQYHSLMIENIALMDKATNIEEYHSAANTFQRFSNTLPDKWLPYYYCSYCFVQMSYLVEDKNERDLYIEEARKYLSVSDSISPDNSGDICPKRFYPSGLYEH